MRKNVKKYDVRARWVTSRFREIENSNNRGTYLTRYGECTFSVFKKK